MCDSITILVLLPDQSQADYERCQYPTRGKEDLDEVSNDFRDQYATSPLTGARFMVTPVGTKLPSKGDVGSIEKNRKNYGRVAGYVVDFNPPTCIVGHNRLLVNSVFAAARVGLALLKHWLAVNGCKREGIDSLKIENIFIISATPTFLFIFPSEAEARYVLANIRIRSEALCNAKTKERTGRQPAFSVPPKAEPGAETYVYTSYIKLREFSFDFYVKVPGLERKTMAKCLDGCPDFVLDEISKRTLRIGVKLHGKWLKDQCLDRVANWRDKEEGYKQAFALLREVLQLDKAFRTKQLRAPSVAKLSLPQTDKTLLRYHLARNIVREHPMFLKMSTTQASKTYSASRLRVLEATGIPFEVDYGEHLKVFTPPLGEQLAYPGEYRPREEMAPFVFSRVSVEQAMAKLVALIEKALKESAYAVDEAVGDKAYELRTTPTESTGNVPLRHRHSRGISGVPVDPHVD